MTKNQGGNSPSLMKKEACETPQLVLQQTKQNNADIRSLAQLIQKKSPAFVVTIARGSSNHAAHYAKALFENELGLMTAPYSLSASSLYHSHLQLKNALVIAISQSGKSIDLYEAMHHAKQQGALTVALVNQSEAPLARAAEVVIPLLAGKEYSIAATKSFICALTTILSLVTELSNNDNSRQALLQLPDYLELALSIDSDILNSLANERQAFVLGRGFNLCIAQEAALKLKEICAIQAEAYSSAEFMHGPLALASQAIPFILFAQSDASLSEILNTSQKIMTVNRCQIALLSTNLSRNISNLLKGINIIELPSSLHPLCDPIVAVQSFYLLVEKFARLKGCDPDHPPLLSKITMTK